MGSRHPPYIMQNMLLELCTEVSKLAHEAEDIVEPETLKLLEAITSTKTCNGGTASESSPLSL